jgi:FAD/FMN-containing dehydrogenase
VGEITEAGVGELRRRFAGPLLSAGDPGYDAARDVWNGSHDRRPGLIARCTGVADVAAAVRFAARHDLLTAVRGGGHSIPGHSVCDDGLMIDLSLMKGMRVDVAGRVAQAEPGLKWGEFDRETGAYGLAVPGGYVSTTGIAGLTLGGGIGWISRKHGLTCDNLIGADVVTAEGELVRADADREPELFWGLRGGGGNFGIVTNFEYRLHRVPSVLGGALIYRGERAAEVLPAFRDFALAAPRELTCLVLMVDAPRHRPYPEDMQGGPVVFVGVCHTGPVDDGNRTLDELRAVAAPDIDITREMSYVKVQDMLDDDGWGSPWYEKASYAREVTDAALATLIERWGARTSDKAQLYMQQMGGAIGDVGEDATPFGGRDTEFVYMAMGGWERGEDPTPHVEWSRETWRALQPDAVDGVYVNFDSDDDAGRVRATYGEKYERLRRLKARCDPGNLFRLNQNIEPA